MKQTATTTTIQLQSAQGADHWRNVFDIHALTLLPSSFQRIKQALNNPSSNADRVAAVMAQDPAACLHFYLHASRLVAGTGNEIHTLTHLISLLGFTQVERILGTLPIAERPLPHYWHQLQISLMRRQLLWALPLDNTGIDRAQMDFSVLFSSLTHWLRWHFASKEQLQFEGLARNLRIGQAKAMQLVYGTDIQALLLAKLSQHNLPQDLRSALAQPKAKWHAVARHLLKAHLGRPTTMVGQRRQNLIFILDRLCQCFSAAPTHHATVRYQTLLAQLLQVSPSTISGALHYVAGQTPLIHGSLLDTHPARRLLCYWPKDFDQPVFTLPSPQKSSVAARPLASTTTSTPTLQDASTGSTPNRLLDNRFANPIQVRDSLRLLSQGDIQLNSLTAILQTLRSGLEDGMGMSCGALMVPTNAGDWVTKFEFDATDTPAIGPLPHAGIVAKISLKPTAILITEDNISALSGSLPETVKAKTKNRELLLISLFLRDKAVALLLVAEADLAPPRVQTCKKLAQATERAIARLALSLKRSTSTK